MIARSQTVSAGIPIVMPAAAAATRRPPLWLLLATGGLALVCLVLAIAETTLWLHYLIDTGESISLVGLLFILIAGLYLYRRRQLVVSMPLVAPWLLFPVITQGDQIIDNLSIDAMRAVTHVLLAALFGMPVAVLVLAVRSAVGARGGRVMPRWAALIPGTHWMASGRERQGAAVFGALLLALQIPVAMHYLGALMIATLLTMIALVLGFGFLLRSRPPRGRRSETAALVLLIAGVSASLGLFLGYKNRPGAYQGSPSHFMDPSRSGSGYAFAAVVVPTGPAAVPSAADAAHQVLAEYAGTLDELLAGYYVLDRNYNYHFHNELFLRDTPLLSNYRAVGLQKIQAARERHAALLPEAVSLMATIQVSDPLGALLADVDGFVGFNLQRADLLERMSGEFEKTKAGLQHATHLYEGEGKFLGEGIARLLEKHRGVLARGELAFITQDFVRASRAVREVYANRIVGF